MVEILDIPIESSSSVVFSIDTLMEKIKSAVWEKFELNVELVKKLHHFLKILDCQDSQSMLKAKDFKGSTPILADFRSKPNWKF